MIVDRARYSEEFYPSKETIELFTWLVSSVKEENKSAVAHMQMIEFIFGKSKFKCVECFRGASKSTLIDVYSVLYYVVKGKKPNFGEVNYILLISDTVTQVAAIFEHILSAVEDNEAIKEHIEIVKSRLGDDPTIVFRNKYTGKKMYLRGKGSGQKLRGLKIGGLRPDYIICDDIENDENVENKESRAKLKNWFFNALLPSVNPNRYEITFIGTPLHEDSLLMNLVNSDKWTTLQLPVAEQYPVDQGHKIESAWADRFTPEYIKEVYEMYLEQGKVNSFYQEMMLVVTPAENKLFDMEKLNYYRKEDLKGILPNLSFYVSVDLAISEKKTADYTVVLVVGVNENNDWFVVDGTFGRWRPNLTIDAIMRYVRKYKPVSVLLEGVAFQQSMKTFVQQEMIKNNMFFNIEMVKRTQNKLAVIKALQPIVELGKLWLPEEKSSLVMELEGEMSMITNDKIFAKHDDVVDALAQLTLVELISGSTPVISELGTNYSSAFKSPYVF